MSPSAWCSSRAWRRAAPWWPPTSRATARRRAATPRWCRPATPRALARALDDALADGRATGPSAEARKEATEYARDWSMDTLAGRYVEIYGRATAASGRAER